MSNIPCIEFFTVSNIVGTILVFIYSITGCISVHIILANLTTASIKANTGFFAFSIVVLTLSKTIFAFVFIVFNLSPTLKVFQNSCTFALTLLKTLGILSIILIPFANNFSKVGIIMV